MYAADSKLRFLGAGSDGAAPAPSGEWLYGNVCEFLADDVTDLHAPIHWVDVDAASLAENRVSISYFAHARPGVFSRTECAGLKLYDRLVGLGYAAQDERAQAARMLPPLGLSDQELLSTMLDWEKVNRVPSGFSVGVSRYYYEGHGGHIRRKSRDDVDPLL